MSTTLRNRVTLQSLTTSVDEGGTFTETWNTVSSLWATVSGNANENLAYEKEQQMNSFVIRVRKQTITNKNRILYKGKILVIESVLDDTGRDNFMIIKAREELV